MTMISIRPASERGHVDHGWLDTYHTFSFADYWDPRHMSFGPLRVINEDRVAPAMGFPTHPHRDMEILTYVLEGELSHKDSMGNGSTMRPGEVQRMSAGTGVRHSERNPSSESPLHFLQIWIFPEREGLPAGYEQKTFSREQRQGRLLLIGSRDGRAGSVTIHQDVDLYTGLLKTGASVEQALAEGRHAWVQLARGGVRLNGEALAAGDGAAVSSELRLRIESTSDAELLLFDLS
jgi:redox-sensitive bicupin YhaK (pirin superfamily)